MSAHPEYPDRDGVQDVIWTASEIRHLPIKDLSGYCRNSRKHSDTGIDRLADAIRQFGFVVPILVDGEGTIIAGHGRFAAAKRAGMVSVPTVCATHLGKAQVRALRIADNRLAELSDWDRETLKIEFADLVELDLAGDLDFDLDITGFDLPEIDILLAGADDGAGQSAETLEAPDGTRPAVTWLGDLWCLGSHRLYCGDSLSPENGAKVLGDEAVGMVFTDPPYNVRVNGHVRSGQSGSHREFAMASGEMSAAEFRSFLKASLLLLLEVLREGGVEMVCMDSHQYP